jgi:hypothetical protein
MHNRRRHDDDVNRRSVRYSALLLRRRGASLGVTAAPRYGAAEAEARPPAKEARRSGGRSCLRQSRIRPEATTAALLVASCGSLAFAGDRPCLRVRVGICPLTSETPGGCIEVKRVLTSMLLARSSSDARDGETARLRLKRSRCSRAWFHGAPVAPPPTVAVRPVAKRRLRRLLLRDLPRRPAGSSTGPIQRA